MCIILGERWREGFSAERGSMQHATINKGALSSLFGKIMLYKGLNIKF